MMARYTGSMRITEDVEQLEALIRQQQLLIQMIESQTSGLRALVASLCNEQTQVLPGPGPDSAAVAAPPRRLAIAR